MRSVSGRRLAGSSLAAAALVALIASAAAASRGHAPRSATNQVGAPVTLTVTLAGDGTGWVTSYPAGISCGTICSAQFPDGTTVSLAATPAARSTFAFAGGAGWSAAPPYVCSSDPRTPGVCGIYLEASSGDASAQATFAPRPPICTVPGKLAGRTLSDAESVLGRLRCGVGKITYAFSLNVQKGRVISQNPGAKWQREEGAPVDLVVGRGRRAR